MSENKENGMLYDISEAVRTLNKVEGFEPKDYLRKEETEDGVSYYLDTKYRLLWFRMKYPEGKLVKIPKALNKEFATFEVRVYTDKNDAENNFLANGFASRYKDDGNEKFGLNFVESAETAALGRALKDAGFGTQFCDIALPNDQTIVDAGVHISFDLAGDEITPVGEENASGTEENDTATSATGNSGTGTTNMTNEAKTKAEPEPVVELTKDMSVEELLEKMTLDFAKSIVVDYGYDRGKTLGKLAADRPQGVQYHASQAKNNLVKAGAMYLLEQAKSA